MMADPRAQIFRRQPMTFPGPAHLPRELSLHFDLALGHLQGGRPMKADFIQSAPASVFLRLTHELSAHFLQRNRVNYKARAHLEEPVALDIDASQWAWALCTDENFCELVTLINLRCCPDPPHGPRTSDIQLNADAMGATIRFSSPQQAARQLQALRHVLRHQHISTLYGVIAILVAVTNAHYFIDGNGRTARVLMNAYCAWKFPMLPYIPFSEIFSKSCGGYEIRLRQAEIQGDWVPLASYLSDCVALFDELQAGSEIVR